MPKEFLNTGKITDYSTYNSQCHFFTSENMYAKHCKLIIDDMTQHCVEDKYYGGDITCYSPEPLSQKMIIDEFKDILYSGQGTGIINYELRKLITKLKEILNFRHGKNADSSIHKLQEEHIIFARKLSNSGDNQIKIFQEKFVDMLTEITGSLLPAPVVIPIRGSRRKPSKFPTTN
jgi:hypothetical protein